MNLVFSPQRCPIISNVDNGGVALSASSWLAERSKHSVGIIEGIVHTITNEKLRMQESLCDIRANFIRFRIVRREAVSFSSALPQFKHLLLKPAYTSYLVFMWGWWERERERGKEKGRGKGQEKMGGLGTKLTWRIRVVEHDMESWGRTSVDGGDGQIVSRREIECRTSFRPLPETNSSVRMAFDKFSLRTRARARASKTRIFFRSPDKCAVMRLISYLCVRANQLSKFHEEETRFSSCKLGYFCLFWGSLSPWLTL